jgi:alpha-beta hydrolase superfamily lysophospholipase
MPGPFPASGEAFSLRRRSWLADEPRRVLVIVHGLAEHSARYDHVGRYFAARGFAVHAFDQRGHGESGGPRVHAPSMDALLDDIEALLALVRDEHPGLPVVLLGHSMGGLEVATLLVRREPTLAAAVLSGPALRVSGGGLRLALARVLSWVVPRMQIPSGISPEAISRDPQVVADYVGDPLIPTTLSVGLGAALIDGARSLEGSGGDVSMPLLIVHGEADSLCDVEGSRAFLADVRTPSSALRTYPELRHEVFNEPEREAVLADVAEWLDKLGAPS